MWCFFLHVYLLFLHWKVDLCRFGGGGGVRAPPPATTLSHVPRTYHFWTGMWAPRCLFHTWPNSGCTGLLRLTDRPVATGGGGGSAQIRAPPRRPAPFAVTIGIEVYPPPPGILSAPLPLLTIPGYGAGPKPILEPGSACPPGENAGRRDRGEDVVTRSLLR